MNECKYRLPCNWCNRLNKYCDMVEPIEIELSDTNKCDHDWVFCEEIIHTGGRDLHYRCRKCGTYMVKNGGVIYQSSSEWQP